MGTMVLARRLPPEQAKLQDRRDLRPELVVTTVREGMGAMPRMTRVDVTDAELERHRDLSGAEPAVRISKREFSPDRSWRARGWRSPRAGSGFAERRSRRRGSRRPRHL
jgi:hypothetical protein